MNRRKWRRNDKKVKIAGFECENCGYHWERNYNTSQLKPICPICGESREISLILMERGNV